MTADGRSVDKGTWKNIQVIMNDTAKFSEALSNKQWHLGVPDDVLKTVIAFFAPGEEVPNAPGSATNQGNKYTNYSAGQKTGSPG